MENQLRELLREVADEVPEYLDMPPRFESRARRRAAFTLGTITLIVAAVVFGSVVGVRSLLRPVAQEPASPRLPIATPSPVPPHATSEKTYSFSQGWGLTYQLPDGWRIDSMGDELNLFSGETRMNPDGLIVVGSNPLSVSGGACAISQETSNAAVFAQQIAANPDVQTTDLFPVLVGGLDGLLLEVEAAPDASISFADSRCPPGVVPLIAVHEYGGPGTGHVYGPGPDERMRVYLLDIPADPSGQGKAGSFVIIVYAPTGDFEQILAEAIPVVESFRFDVD